MNTEEQDILLDAYLSTCSWNEIYYSWQPNLKDGDDNFLVELAVASGARYILTYNLKDFTDTELLFDYTVTTPETFIKEFS
ncbi:MAG: PIN domain-containing protein [Sulfurovum sp.]|nr:PIN domain-containing protein [Sulfurovum sp.]MCB4763103.1 PIN domain-containing protein [Sulfurovum sp.]MCB4773378.1 PIN domain-containing protein [Sulfurovum sp.]MCB4780954.1 PIN domain-containing protein [Sulfurovum sp.]MCB4781748.1 PIN domain-containing protein [Sulfurovum sp.]